MQYATAVQLADWLGTSAPADADRQLRRASADIDAALLTAVYDTDDTGAPTDTAVAAAFADAACAQVEWWAATGDDGTGAAGRWESVSAGPVSLSGRAPGPASPAGVELAPRAWRALQAAGLCRDIDDAREEYDRWP